MKIIYHLLFIFSLFISANSAIAQVESINTDRPDQSDGVYTIPKNTFQLENGITIAKQTVINNLMLRYGLTPSTEIRLLLDVGKEFENKGLLPVSLSFKQRIIEQKEIIPAMTLVGYVAFEQLASKDFKGNKLPFEIKMAFENEINDKFSIGYNLGTSNQFKDLNLSAALGYNIIDKISTFVEYFSTLSKNGNEHNIDAGILYIINPKLQIDIAYAQPLHGLDNKPFSTIGISYSFR
ncbi:transporter [Tannerella forsythia]|uniref:Transporter n=1 Tax=Tannerella forsythia TaxID=28112 RepID=A0A3P1XK23_TANFO|nr:transporter [Tannerella forsythia]RRD59109.1 transporter [Tannerella forsythia]